MKTVITVRSLILHSFLIIIFAACGVNATNKAEICSHKDSEIFIAEDKSNENKIEKDSHPMLLPRESNYSSLKDNKSHPMFISPCSEEE
ncbi:hypothetical protein NIES267_05310 [Calothrix parasitica NIES-267]|uniref:Lipoprotein n=1 Tax=Calothrix parasitica NIES-267 TaxID=1973488 RepID=A0A1Z4LIK7_9CYAN|nr:hypothetical protein NIES267_05310 [Calothrix parasitica NIES-267]